MSKTDNLTDFLTDVANAIRDKKGITAKINPQNFSTEIAEINTQKEEQEKTVTITENGTTEITPDSGKVLSKATVVVAVPTEEKKIEALEITENGTYTATDVDGYSPITVDVHDIIDVDGLPTTDIDTNKYYRMGDALYKAEQTLKDTTWTYPLSSVNNEGFVGDYVVYGTTIQEDLEGIHVKETGFIVWTYNDIFIKPYTGWSFFFSSTTDTQRRNSGAYYTFEDYLADKDDEQAEKTYSTSKKRAMTNLADDVITITGGKDVTNPTLIAWLQENATLQSGNILTWKKYCDVSDTTATAEQVLNTVYFYTKDGVRTQGGIVPDITTSGTIKYKNTSYPFSAGYYKYEHMVSIDSAEEAKIIPENIKKDVSILGVTGTLEAGIDTSDATAAADDIIEGKTAYVNGKKLTGTIENHTESEITLSAGTGDQYVPKGHYSDIRTKLVLDSTAANIIKSGEKILGVTGTYDVEEYDGTITIS